MLQPAMFLHFALTFPERKSLVQNAAAGCCLLVYLPGCVLLASGFCW